MNKQRQPQSITLSSWQRAISAGLVQVTLASFCFKLLRKATCRGAAAECWSCCCRWHSLRHGSLHIINQHSAARRHSIGSSGEVIYSISGVIVCCESSLLPVFTGCLCRQH